MQINVIKYVIFCKHTHTHMYIDDKCIKSTFFVKDIKLLSSYSGWRYIKSYIIRSWNARNGVHLTEDTCVTWFRWPFTVILTYVNSWLCYATNIHTKSKTNSGWMEHLFSHLPPTILSYAKWWTMLGGTLHITKKENQNQTLLNLRNIQHTHYCELCRLGFKLTRWFQLGLKPHVPITEREHFLCALISGNRARDDSCKRSKPQTDSCR